YRTFVNPKGSAAEIPVDAKRAIAKSYVNIVVMADEARRLGLEQSPDVQYRLRIQKLEILARAMEERLQEQSSQIAPQDIVDYYTKNKDSFVELTVHRLLIPRHGATQAPAADTKTAPVPGELTEKDAEQYRARILAGEDFDKVQKEILDKLGFKITPPPSENKVRHGQLPPAEEQEVFALQEHQLSRIFTDANLFTIYRVDARGIQTMEQSGDTIRAMLVDQRMKDATAAVTDKAVVDRL